MTLRSVLQDVAVITAGAVVIIVGVSELEYTATELVDPTWVVDTTPHYKGHPAGYDEPIAVCVHTRTGEERRVTITHKQAFGDASGQGFLKAGERCPS